MLLCKLCVGLLAVAVKLPKASGSRRFSDRNRRLPLPITLLRHCRRPASPVFTGAPDLPIRSRCAVLLKPGSLGELGRVLMTQLSPQYVLLIGRFLICFERKEGCFLPSKVFNSQEPYSVKATKIFSMSFVRRPENSNKTEGITSLLQASPARHALIIYLLGSSQAIASILWPSRSRTKQP